MLDGPIPEALTFDDVLLVPAKSSVLPSEADVRTYFSRNVQLNIPIVSAAMDTVTESRLAIALAQQGGIGIMHRTMSPEQQALEIDKVKRSESGRRTVNWSASSPTVTCASNRGPTFRSKS